MSDEHAAHGLGEDIDEKLTAALARIEIPPRPAIVDQILGEMQRDEPDYHHLAHLIVSDVGIAAGLIKTANAPIFGYRSKAGTVREALTMLGLLMVSRTVAGLALRHALPEGHGLAGFWESSARVALLSAWLVRRLGVRDGVRVQDAHTYGLFRDCGIPVLMKTYANYSQTLAAACREPLRPFTEVEEGFNLLNHALVGSTMARGWYLPESDCLAIAHHHLAESLDADGGLPPASRRLIAIGQLADRLQAADAPADHEWDKLGARCLDTLGLAAADLAGLEAEAREALAAAD